jgi:hypothetical protein
MLRNPDIQPTEDVIANALGDANDAYVMFINKLPEHDIQLEWRYYTDGNSWLAKGLYRWTGARGGKKETTVFWLSVWDGFFKVTIYFQDKFRANILGMTLSNEVNQKISESKQMGNKLKYFPLVFDLYSNEMFEDIFNLIEYKKTIK